jgi:Do/DeqQ family serine protease
MGVPSWIKFLLQSVTAGLAAAFVILLIRPQWMAGLTSGPGPDGEGQGPRTTYSTAVAAAAPGVVNIYTSRYVNREQNPLFSDPLFRRFFGEYLPDNPTLRRETSLGSGVVVDTAGYVLTNHHVVAGADAIEVALFDGRSARGTLIGTDPDTDLAVIRTDLADLPTVSVSDSDALRVGDIVLAIGNPFGVGQTVTQGIVSATGRSRVGINTFENFIQTDAAINPGNSGGALVNVRGELVGINTAIMSRSGGSQGIGFAIPVNMAREVMDSIVRNGTVVRGWLGVEAYDLTPEARSALGVGGNGGAIVKGVVMNGPADDAGLQPYDVITHVNGEAVQSAGHEMRLISQLQPGAAVELTIVRQGRTLTLQAVVMQRPRQSFTTG